jgi:hypothetical protein
MSKISIRLFGALEIRGPDGEPIRIVGTKLQGLLAYLALHWTCLPAATNL